MKSLLLLLLPIALIGCTKNNKCHTCTVYNYETTGTPAKYDVKKTQVRVDEICNSADIEPYKQRYFSQDTIYRSTSSPAGPISYEVDLETSATCD